MKNIIAIATFITLSIIILFTTGKGGSATITPEQIARLDREKKSVEMQATAQAIQTQAIEILTPVATPEAVSMLGSKVYAAEAATATDTKSGSQAPLPKTASSSDGASGSLASVMHISEQGLSMIKKYEGFRSCAYWDIKMWTIGYGSAGKKGQCISEIEADKMLRDQVYVKEIGVHRLVKVTLSQQQYDALVSFAYNMGTGALEGSDLLKKLNAGKYSQVPAELARWVHGGGQKLGGLVKRRAEEAKAFQ